MDFGKVLANPIVWGGGAAIGLFLLMRAPNANAAVQATSGYNPAVLSAVTQMNTTAMGAHIEEMKIAADLERARFARDTTTQAQTLAYLKNINATQVALEINGQNTRAGITQAMISSSTMLALDVQQNANRLALGMQETERSRIKAEADVDVARYQYKGQKASAISGAIGSVAGAAGKILGGII